METTEVLEYLKKYESELLLIYKNYKIINEENENSSIVALEIIAMLFGFNCAISIVSNLNDDNIYEAEKIKNRMISNSIYEK